MTHGREDDAASFAGVPVGGDQSRMTGGITARPAEMRLTERAADYLASGPADAVALIGHICQLPNPPRVVAEHMATALFTGRTQFVRAPTGEWSLAKSVSADAPVSQGQEGSVYMSVSTTASFSGPAADAGTSRPVRLPVIDPLTPPRGYTTRRSARARPADASERALDDLSLTPCDAADLLASLSYVVVDVETTGSRPWAGDRVTEIAAVVVRDGEVREVFETLVNPQRPIPPMITALTNISWAMVKDAPVFRDVCARVLAAMEGNVFVAHNAAFDWRFVTAEVSRAMGHELAGRQLCTVRLARKLLPHLRSRSLDHVAAYYGVNITARHRAAGDAIATAHVLLRLLRDARDRGCESWPALEQLIRRRKARPRRSRPSAMPRPVDRDCGS